MEQSLDSRALNRWIKIAEDAQIIRTPGPKAVQCSKPSTEIGVSLGYLKRFMDSLEGFLDGRDTYCLVNKLICMVTARPPSNKKGRFYDYIPLGYTGQPNYYVVHPWSNGWQDTIEQLISTLTDARDDSLTPGEVNTQLDSTYVWIDWVACNQFCRPTSGSVLNVRDLVKVCNKGAALVIDTDLKFMSRTWCLYETWCFAYYGDITKLCICLPEDTTVSSIVQLDSMIEKVDLGRTESKDSKDASRIMSQVKSCVGMKLFCRLLKDVLALHVRSRLRWSSKLEELAQYCGAMLHIGEYGHLQQEIKDIYRLYDTEGKGVLDEGQFLEVLELAGFEKEEADKVLKQSKRETKDGVTIIEFEMWWMQSQRQNEALYRRPVVMTTEALVNNLVRMQAFVERMGLHDLAEHFTLYIAKIEHGNMNYGEAELVPAPLKGEWQAMTDLCAWKLHVGDFKAAFITNNRAPPPNHAPLESLAQQQLEFSKFGVVRDMIALKYGQGKPLERGLIVEAEKSLGVWMAANKTRGKVESPSEVEQMKDMALNYLVTYNSPADDSSLINSNPKTKLSSIMGGLKLEHDIPEYGPYTSCLASLGPDARAWLDEFEAQHNEERAQTMSEPSQMAKEALAALNKKNITKVVWKPPSFNSALKANPKHGDGALGKVIVSRLTPKSGHQSSDASDSDAHSSGVDADPSASDQATWPSLSPQALRAAAAINTGLKAKLLVEPPHQTKPPGRCSPPKLLDEPPHQTKPPGRCSPPKLLDEPVESTWTADTKSVFEHSSADHAQSGAAHCKQKEATSPGSNAGRKAKLLDEPVEVERASCPTFGRRSVVERSSCPTMRHRNPLRDMVSPTANLRRGRPMGTGLPPSEEAYHKKGGSAQGEGTSRWTLELEVEEKVEGLTGPLSPQPPSHPSPLVTSLQGLADPLSPQPPSAPREGGEERPNHFSNLTHHLMSPNGQKGSQARLPRTSDSHALGHRNLVQRPPPISDSGSGAPQHTASAMLMFRRRTIDVPMHKAVAEFGMMMRRRSVATPVEGGAPMEGGATMEVDDANITKLPTLGVPCSAPLATSRREPSETMSVKLAKLQPP
eukprot:gene4954-34733_t